MAGHSRFKKIKHKKAIEDKKRSKEFSKVSHEISVAVKAGGGDPNDNPRLRMAISTARRFNFPKAKVDDAIRKGLNPNDGESIEEVRYEGFGPSGVALLVEAISHSKQLANDKSAIRKVFSRHNGSLGEGGCVSFIFQRLGLITYPGDDRSEDDMMMLAIEHGADDCQKVEDEFEILCSFEKLHEVKEKLEKQIGEPSSAKPIWKPNSYVTLDNSKTKSVLRLIDELEDVDAVQEVWSNLEIPDSFNYEE
ncbi:probable transcriptional regulatory protein GOX1679 [Macrosteles quadrilineatus]|uniref:probable transcriptional regulatory protein GOX1679 n=1 Tax=Macrosteles quadrilineatus TaxID=74068 RepID=UPI0023E32AE1|nr:probable transcriptional regulatory protein GOX1679 [Macrosteles quadrilineatus]